MATRKTTVKEPDLVRDHDKGKHAGDPRGDCPTCQDIITAGEQAVVSDLPARVERDRALARPAAILDMMASLAQQAVEHPHIADTMEKLVTLHERVSDRAAAQEFADALAAFQQECPKIPKTRTAKIATKSGGTFTYSFADLETIDDHVREPMHRHGLSYSFDSEIHGDNVTAICIVSHVNGHSRPSRFTAPLESRSGASPQQKAGAATTYAKRQALVAALGLTTTDPDDDGADYELVNEKQVADLECIIEELAVDPVKFLEYLGIDSLDKLQARRYKSAIAALERKRRQQT